MLYIQMIFSILYVCNILYKCIRKTTYRVIYIQFIQKKQFLEPTKFDILMNPLYQLASVYQPLFSPI